MSKNSRERKQAKLERIARERQAIAQRQSEKRQWLNQFIKRLSLAVAATLVILYVGTLINAHLVGILLRIKGKI